MGCLDEEWVGEMQKHAVIHSEPAPIAQIEGNGRLRGAGNNC